MKTLIVNDVPREVDAQPMERLSDVLRRQLRLTGTKVGCNTGDCGACTVLVDNRPVCSCITPFAQVQGSQVLTVEGLESDGALNGLQQSFLHYGAAQCGICTPGMLMAATALLARVRYPTSTQVEDALGGVLCRCTGYRKIVQAVMNATAFSPDEEVASAGHNVGVALPHLDGQPKVTGELAFGDDNLPDDALVVRVIRSPYHCAAFEIGDVPSFLDSHPGIEHVLSAEDIPGNNCFGVIAPYADQPVFAVERVRFRGEAVAAVVGEPTAVAALNIDAFPVQWREMTPLMSTSEALAEDATLIHSHRKLNILTQGLVERGDVSQALNTCVNKTTVSCSTPFIEHAYIEPEAGYAIRVGNRIEIRGCTQATHMDREAMSDIMAMDPEDIRVVPSACGGGFGSKIDLSYQPFIGLAAWVSNKAVGICYTRPESMRSTTKRHPSQISLSVGCDEKGKITAFDFAGTFNTGAYASWGPTVANRVPVHASGPYFIPHYRARSTAVHTNSPPAGAFRGFGVPQSAVAQELAFDNLAASTGIDRLDFRLLNALRNNQPTVTGQVFSEGVGIIECLEALRDKWQVALRRASAFNREAGSTDLRKGVGLATCWYGCGNTSLPNPSTIRFGLRADGKAVLHQGAMDIGQGSNTVITQIAADALGVTAQEIIRVDGDTDLTPDCGKTSASRQTFITGSAAKQAGEALRQVLLKQANVGPNATVQLGDGVIKLEDSNGPPVTLDLSTMPENSLGYVFMVEETFDPVTEPLDDKGQGAPYAQYGYGAQMMELTVDTRLGTIDLDHITTAHDVGRAINPMLVEGQIEGGVAQGIGMALMENYQPGRTENLHDYLIPTIGDMPGFTHIIVEVADLIGPYGAKGLGEHVLIPTAPAILSAIRHATGAVVQDLPATPDKVLTAIHAKSDPDERNSS